MQTGRMCGIVLWASQDDGRAVIWCEDHGNLAFYKAAERDAHAGPSLDPGDLIDFEINDAPEHREARNPRLLAHEHAPRIVSGLRQSAQDLTEAATLAPDSNVVAFPGPRRQSLRTSKAAMA